MYIGEREGEGGRKREGKRRSGGREGRERVRREGGREGGFGYCPVSFSPFQFHLRLAPGNHSQCTALS